MILAYGIERRNFLEYKQKVSNIYANVIIKKLARHFKLSRISCVEFYGYSDSGQASLWRGRIRLSNHPTLGIVCHEVNHFLCWKKYGTGRENRTRHGTKKWYRQLTRIIKYGSKMNWWKEEYERRITPKPPKIEPTKEEIRLEKIKRIEQSIKRHNTKIKRCQTLIKKANRRIAGLKRFV